MVAGIVLNTVYFGSDGLLASLGGLVAGRRRCSCRPSPWAASAAAT